MLTPPSPASPIPPEGSSADSSSPTAAPPATDAGQVAPPYLGTFELKYPDFVLRAECDDERHLAWTFPDGGGERVAVDRRPIAPQVYLTTWTEHSGLVVVQVANYETNTLHAVLVDGPKRTVLRGTMRRLSP